MKARTLLITGVSSGLGTAFTRSALSKGHRIVGTVRNAADADAFTRKTGAPALLFDLAQADDALRLVADAKAMVGGIDVLVNNAGFGHEGALEESPLAALRRQLDVNVVGQVALMQAVLPGMRARRHGHIINVTSMAGSVGLPGVSFYCGAKFALDGISEALGKELRPLGIHITAFAPGQFRTDWAGRSMERSLATIADYDAIVGPLREARQAGHGLQPGDPSKAAALLMRVIASANPPARIFVGPDAVGLAGQKIKRMQAELAAWKDVAVDTSFDTTNV